MQTDWLFGLLGGLMIGSAAALFLLVNGRIMGASGILGAVVERSAPSKWKESSAFLLGTFLAPIVFVQLAGPQETHLTENWAVLIVAGLCVGIGTRLANGCTSGHGVCGISRFNLRGIVATLFYIFAGGMTLVFFRHLWGVI